MRRDHQTSELEFPSNASANGPLNFRRCGVNELWNEFQVPAIQEVAAHQGELQMRARPPSQMEIQGIVAGNGQAWEFVHISKAEVLFEVLRQIDGGLHKELMLRALSIGIIACRVQAIFVFSDVHLQVAVRTE